MKDIKFPRYRVTAYIPGYGTINRRPARLVELEAGDLTEVLGTITEESKSGAAGKGRRY